LLSLSNQIATAAGEMPLLPGVSDELATHHSHHSHRYDGHYFSVEVLLVTI
jgi:hypothetical protein